MDLWSRLIGGVGASSSTKQSNANNPQQRLARFKRAYGQLQQTCRTPTSVSTAPLVAENVYIELQRLTSILREESGAAAPHVCLRFASSARIHATISKITSTYYHEGITQEAVLVFSILIDSEEEELIGDAGFAGSLMAFLSRIAGSGAMVMDVETEGQIVELLFGIATKIRLKPDILPVWFVSRVHDEERVREDVNATSFVGAAHKEDFPLFYLLLHYVHHEGSVGDFARTGLLYIIESASHSEDLEGWIIESDLATLMASGLGALYSQLSRKLVISFSKEEIPAVLVLSDYSTPQPVSEAEVSTSPEFRGHMDTFLSYLIFWQDVLEHCRSVEVKQTLFDHFQILFLQQLLYPSLLESSDIDGGSSVAVLTYLRRILESINHPDLIHLILQYLFAISDQPIHKQMSLPGDRMSASRRKSLNLLTHFADGEDKPSPTLFNLGDLILTSLRSKSQQTVAATLKLVSVMIQRHHQYVISTLLRTSPAVQSRPQRTIGAHNKEMELLFSLIDDLGEDDNLDKSYDNHIKDNLSLLECHPCSAQLLANQDTSSPTNTSSATSIPRNSPNDLDLRNLRPDDSLLRAILTLLRTFLTNSAETNLNLTEVVAGLASCGYVLIEGWLVVDPSNDLLTNGVKFLPVHDEDLHCDLDLLIGEQHNEIDDNDRDQMRALQMAHRQPFWTAEDTSPVFAVLQSLVDQIHIYRTEIPNFDTYLSERKQAFQVDEKLTEALASIPPIHSSQDCSRFSTSSTLSPDIGPLGSIAQRMFPEQASASISRPSSPRGRQRVLSEAPTPFGKLRQLSLKGSPSPSQASRRAISPSPLRKDFLSPTPPQPSSVRTADVDVLKRKVSITSKSPIAKVLAEGRGSSETSSLFSESTAPNDEKEMAPVEVSVSHLLTNVLILQEFVLELAAIIQVRASLFGEVKFT